VGARLGRFCPLNLAIIGTGRVNNGEAIRDPMINVAPGWCLPFQVLSKKE
jgi:hypothetical protein